MKIFPSFLNLFYPNHCLHCFAKVENQFFCKTCISCFALVYPQKNRFEFTVFEKKGPICSFLKEIKNLKIYGLIKLAASFIVVQHNKLNWEVPDIIVPVSENNFFHKDHLYYLSKEVALLFNKPLILKSKSDQTVLFIDDIFNTKNIEKINSQNNGKTYYMSLCIDFYSNESFE